MEENTSTQSFTNSSTNSTSSSGGSMKTVGIVVVILALLGLGYYFMSQKNAEQKAKEAAVIAAQKQQEEAQQAEDKAKEEAMNQAQEAVQEATNPQVTLVKAQAEALRPLLSQNGVKSLDAILVYIDGNPEALLTKKTSYPQAVQDAITAVQKEIKKSVAVAKVENVKENVLNKTYTLVGTLGMVEDPEMNPLGANYMLTTENGNVFYFILTGQSATSAKSLVGKQAQVDVKVTGVENGYVMYEVVKGPTAVATTAPTKTTETTEETEE